MTDEIENSQPSLAMIIEERLQGIERRLKKIEKFCEKRLGQKYYESFEVRISALEEAVENRGEDREHDLRMAKDLTSVRGQVVNVKE